ncbi:MAG: TonB-dependent receptor [Pseudomonadota bacterium]|nr:TonB-dependent receptor [Pseudomonadota bacterium]
MVRGRKRGLEHGTILLGACLAALVPTSGQADTDDTRLENVVVTAQRRDQSVEDVGLSISVLDQELLDALHIDTFDRLADFTPGLQVSPGIGSGNPVFTIRGIGSTIIWSNNNPSVAVHVDEIYHASSAYMSFPLFDIERIEVLKGPQGTLYGRNSTAGAVNIVTATPSAETGFQANAEYGSDDAFEYRQSITGALSSQLNGRLAIYTRQGGGHQDSRGPNGISEGYSPDPGTVPAIPPLDRDPNYGDLDQLAFRASLAWTPSTWLDADLSVHGARDQSEVPIDKLRNMDALGFVPPSDDPYTVYGNRENDSRSNQQGGVLRVNALFDELRLSSVTGYEAVDRYFVQEDGSPYRITDGDFYEDLSSLTQELRLASASDGAHFWLLGAFASRDRIDFDKDINILDVLKTVIDTGFVEDDESWALFAHDEWRFAPLWKLTTGLRYTDETKRYRGGTRDRDPWGVSNAAAILPQTIDVDREYSDSQTTGRLALDYAPREGLLLYASASLGFKSGGFDGSLITSESATLPYDAEKLRAYEAGIKRTLLDRRLFLALSAFYYDYSDKQVQATIDIGGGVTESIIQNAAASEAYGGELELRWTPSAALEITLGTSLLSTEITDWDSASPEEAAARIGNELPNAPEWTANAALDHRVPVGASLIGFANLNVSHTDGSFREVANNPDLASEDVTLFGARIGMAPINERWSLYLWGRNLTDEEYRTYSRRPLGAMITDQYGLPRMVGLGASLRYGS